MRKLNRTINALRPIHFTTSFTQHAEGSVLVEFGNTKVICNASITSGVPLFLRDSDQGWLTAEYGMLPRSTHERMAREASKGKQSGRTQEIQRLIGRSLRAAVDLKALKNYTITIDCDVIQADGGTRTASITGGCVALHQAIQRLIKAGTLSTDPFLQFIASVSVGMVNNEACLDLDYEEDSNAETDMNVVMTDSNQIIEIQGTAEKIAFSRPQLNEMLNLAEAGIAELVKLQKSVAFG